MHLVNDTHGPIFVASRRPLTGRVRLGCPGGTPGPYIPPRPREANGTQDPKELQEAEAHGTSSRDVWGGG